ncbi:hypothetical protein SBX64_11495 [Vibrio rhizosphaerae]|uniref:Uncharacterized protein n=1 Tax=Vibrio rhizosphaerae TaxID=398736 RepID=A0ABU4IWS9_9VIBR|nr:hypothetical protein [Vibrio rhizosphaerae]MDW6093171.1 hypothetical protein [Vibrio rhizosphaerae]
MNNHVAFDRAVFNAPVNRKDIATPMVQSSHHRAQRCKEIGADYSAKRPDSSKRYRAFDTI